MQIGGAVRIGGGISMQSTTVTATSNNISPRTMEVGASFSSFAPLTVVPGTGTGPYNFYVVSGSLPSGVTLIPTSGLVVGVPTATYSNNSVTFGVSDVDNFFAANTATVYFSVLPAVTATATTTAQVLEVTLPTTPFTPLTPSGGFTPYSYSINSGTLPAGLTYWSGNGVVTGTPTASQTISSVKFQVQDSLGAVASTTSTVNYTVYNRVTATANTAGQIIEVNTASAPFVPLAASLGSGL